MKPKNAGYRKVNEVFFCWDFPKDDYPYVCLFRQTDKGIVLQQYSCDNSGHFLVRGYRKASDVIDEFAERLIQKVTVNNVDEGYLVESIDYACLVDDIKELADEMRKEVEK